MQEEVRQLIEELRHAVTRPWAVMEVCGGQTHAIASLGLEELLPPGLRLIHGPGCPVCVTAVELIDQAVELSLRPGVVLCSYGDMMRVPGSRGDLFSAKARGGDVPCSRPARWGMPIFPFSAPMCRFPRLWNG